MRCLYNFICDNFICFWLGPGLIKRFFVLVCGLLNVCLLWLAKNQTLLVTHIFNLHNLFRQKCT